MNISLLERLCCPFCGGNLRPAVAEPKADELKYAILTCDCGRYPVVGGIPILKKGTIGAAKQRADRIIAMIETGRYREALLAMLLPPPPASKDLTPLWMRRLPSIRGVGRVQQLVGRRGVSRWREQARALLTTSEEQATAYDLIDLYFRRSGKKNEVYNYFLFRFGQPRHLVALSFASLIPPSEKPVLDLACGFGQITRNICQLDQGRTVIGLDHDFYCLYVAQGWIAPEAAYVCCAADAPLPFPKGTFSTVFSSDAFQLFDNKVGCMRELRRLTEGGGLIMLVEVRNELARKTNGYRTSLPPAGYEALVADMPHRLTAHHDVLTRYLQKQGPPLSRSAAIEYLNNEPWLSVVASPREELFQDYGTFNDWPHALGRLTLNPLYREEERDADGGVHLRLTMPSTWYEQENGDCRQYEPETVEINSKVLNALAEGQRTPEIESLIAQCVVLGMPERCLPTATDPWLGKNSILGAVVSLTKAAPSRLVILRKFAVALHLFILKLVDLLVGS